MKGREEMKKGFLNIRNWKLEWGFTLIEVLVAVGILSAMGALIYSAINIQIKAKKVSDRLDERYHAARVALFRMQREIAMAFLSNHTNPLEKTTTTLFLGEDDSLLFTFFGNEKITYGTKESDQAVVEYYLENSGDGRKLIRRIKKVLDERPEKEGVKEVLATGVKELHFEYWDKKNEKWKKDWKAQMEEAYEKGLSKPSTERVITPPPVKILQEEELKEFMLPERVFIRLVLFDDEGREYPFETQTRIHTTYPLNF